MKIVSNNDSKIILTGMIFIEFLRLHAKKVVVVVSIIGEQKCTTITFQYESWYFIALITLPATLT